MFIDHDSHMAVEAAVALVNSKDPRTGTDTLTAPRDLARFLDDYRFTGARDGSADELRSVRQLRTALRAVFDAAAKGEVDSVLSALNGLISASGAVPFLTQHDGNPLHFHYAPAEAPVRRRLAADMAVNLAVIVRDGGGDRLRVCASPDCGRALIDLSRNRSRLYCDTQCGNRQHVAAYRTRRA
jgi:predicted RNA-binding Zn ribbon-like protein